MIGRVLGWLEPSPKRGKVCTHCGEDQVEGNMPRLLAYIEDSIGIEPELEMFEHFRVIMLEPNDMLRSIFGW